MKKLVLLLAAHLTALSLATNAIGQNNFLPASTTKVLTSESYNNVESLGKSTRAMKKFKKDFPAVTGEVWSTAEDGYMVSFLSNGIQNRVYLSKKGACQSIVRYYSEKQLPAEIRHQVKTIYYDYAIPRATEVTTTGKTAYLVTVEGSNSWKVIQVVEGEMDVWEDHQKN